MRERFGKKTGLLIGAAAVAVIALLAAAAGGLFSPPKERLGRAMVRSFSAWAEAEDAWGLPDLGKLTEERSVSRRMSFRLANLDTDIIGYDLSALEGLGLRFQSDLNGREMGAELTAFQNNRELLSVLLAVDDAEACLASPQLTGGEFYGVNTETLGEDLKRMGVRDTAGISFNFFDLVDIVAPVGQAEEIKRDVKEASKELFEAAGVEKGGKETIFVNQAEIRTDVYQVTIPEEAVRDYVNALAGALSKVDDTARCREVCRAVGAPEDMLEELLDELGDPCGDLAEVLGSLPDELGGVALTVHVGGGYVSAVRYEGYLFDGDTFLELELYLGGGEEYVDDLRLEVAADGRRVVIGSSGDHGGKSGAFTDKTTIRGRFFTVSSQFRYEPGREDNLSWEINIPGAGSLEMAGTLTLGEESAGLHLDELALKALGMELCSAEMEYFMGPCQGRSVTARNPRLIGEMSGLELMAAALKLRASTRAWTEDMRSVFNF